MSRPSPQTDESPFHDELERVLWTMRVISKVGGARSSGAYSAPRASLAMEPLEA